jgi:hypothetical protein
MSSQFILAYVAYTELKFDEFQTAKYKRNPNLFSSIMQHRRAVIEEELLL